MQMTPEVRAAGEKLENGAVEFEGDNLAVYCFRCISHDEAVKIVSEKKGSNSKIEVVGVLCAIHAELV